MTEKKEDIRVVIYGAGAVGCAVGGLLALSGTEVVLVGRPGNVRVISENGLEIVTPTRIYFVHLMAVTALNQIVFNPTDVIFLCVKGQDTEGAMRDISTVVKDIPIFCFQNGIRNEEIVSQYYSNVYGVMVESGLIFTTDGKVIIRKDPPGRLVIGRYPEGKDIIVEKIAAKLQNARYDVLVTSEIMPYKWGKLLLNLNNAIHAITNSATGEKHDLIVSAVQNEGREILCEAGIRWMEIQEPPKVWSNYTKWSDNASPEIPLGSTWQSLKRRQGSVETEFLNGEIVRTANKLGKQAPINETLMRVVQEMAANHELPGKYSDGKLIKILGLD